MIQGIKNANVPCHIFRHNDVGHLKELLNTSNASVPKLIVLESLYSMEGLRSPLKQIVSLAKEFNALTYLDEVHSVGLYGNEGRGIANEQDISDDIDIINGTLSKAFGQMGGYIAASSDIIDFVRSFAPGFIFTSSANPSIAAASIKAIEIAKKSENLREDIRINSNLIRSGLRDLNIPHLENDSHIIPIHVEDPRLCKEAANLLIDDHAKNIEALEHMLNVGVHCFWHESDHYTITSNGFIWTYPGHTLTPQSICVMPEKFEGLYSQHEINNCAGVCSDFIGKYKI